MQDGKSGEEAEARAIALGIICIEAIVRPVGANEITEPGRANREED